jgi:hypothetical protein
MFSWHQYIVYWQAGYIKLLSERYLLGTCQDANFSTVNRSIWLASEDWRQKWNPYSSRFKTQKSSPGRPVYRIGRSGELSKKLIVVTYFAYHNMMIITFQQTRLNTSSYELYVNDREISFLIKIHAQLKSYFWLRRNRFNFYKKKFHYLEGTKQNQPTNFHGPSQHHRIPY